MEIQKITQVPLLPLSLPALQSVFYKANLREGIGGALLLFVVLFLAFQFVSGNWWAQHRLEEPPLIRQRIPLIGHLLSLYQYGLEYFSHLHSVYPSLPIFTIKIFNKPIYVVNTPEMAKAVEQQTKSLSFMPLEIAVSERILQIGKPEMQRIDEDMRHSNGQSGYMKDLHNTHQKLLSPGPALNMMKDEGMAGLSGFLDDTKDGVIDLFSWCRHIFTLASARAVWGKRNPFVYRPELEDAFWIVEDELRKLIVNIYPTYTAPAGSRAREELYQAFLSYYETHAFEDPTTSGFVRAKTALNRKHGFSATYMARTDLGELTAVLFNVVPASFWLLAYIFSTPILLADLRNELRQVFGGDLAHKRAFNPTELSQCSLLVSIYQEVLRIIGAGVTTNRVVLADTWLTPTTCLRKGGIVQIPGNVFHSDASIWGSDVDSFNPRRFIGEGSGLAKSAAFRTFGGGASKCPGRHFAYTQILAFTVKMVMGFDMVPLDGVWKLPEMDKGRLPGVLKPIGDMRVTIKRRQDLGQQTSDL